MTEKRKTVFVTMKVDAPADVPADEVRRHIKIVAHSAKGQYTGIGYGDWRADLVVTEARTQYPRKKPAKRGRSVSTPQ